ncbi:hypothetical protein PS662_05662 [Pseudomonas fluorescens]|uniref:Uncharacterized protein n=1 Tax=Pseudomonas fluorescens TaxID=294 RepID=A0A5E6SVH1_PSEFL|nr:hypothetical protein PS645_02448 [Pseudomonas fluorescens]VVN43842.1 hypothetical protein PS662_05662 [Pseudomonas fluorescens]
MTFSSSFRPDSAPVTLDDTFNYLMLSSLHWNDADL